MTQQVINIGTSANDGSGDPLRTAFDKINSNFTEIYSKGASGSNLDISENEIAATNSNGNIELVPSGSGRVSIVDDTLTITTSRTPASIGSDGDVAGMIAWDSTNLYVSTADYDGSTTIWTTLSTGSATDLILSTDTSNSLTSTSNGNINITPNGTGDINLIADTVVVGDLNTQTIVTTNGTGNLLLTTNFNSSSGNIVIVQGTNGNIDITTNGTGVTNITRALLAAGTATASTAPLKMTSGTNLTAAEAGAVEYDGTTLTFTPSTNYGRAAIPATVYTSGVGTSLTPTATGEATAQALFPAAGDTITLPIGTYHITLVATITRGATSVTSATARINFGGGGTAVGSFTGTAVSSVAAAGATSQFMFNGVALTVDNVVSAANALAAGVYNIMITGILRITTAGTFVPKYSLSANLASASTATAPSALNYLMIQSVGTSGTAAATGGWA